MSNGLVQPDEVEPDLELDRVSSGYSITYLRRASSLQSEDPHQVMAPGALYGHVLGIARQAADTTGLPLQQSLLLLRKYKWNYELFQSAYFQGEPHSSQDYSLSPQASGTCPVCCEQQRLLLSQSCGHFICGECWKEYLAQSLLSECFVRCPQCGQTPISLQFYRLLELEPKFAQALQSLFVQESKFARWCPGKSCGRAVLFQRLAESNKFWRCHCGEELCLKCAKSWHRPCSCERAQAWMQLINSDINLRWIRLNTKECPSCKASVQRSTGCNLMRCTVCAAEFCFHCAQPWADHPDHFRCPRAAYDVVAPEQKQEFQRLGRFVQKYKEHQLGLASLKTYLAQTVPAQLVALGLLDLCKDDTAFIGKAFSLLIDSTELLMWSFPLSYFLHCQKNSTLKLYCFKQAFFQECKEKLAFTLQQRLGKLARSVSRSDKMQRPDLLRLFYEGKDESLRLSQQLERLLSQFLYQI